MADVQHLTPGMKEAEREVARTLRREKISAWIRYTILLLVGPADALPAGVDVLGVVQTEP
ncbi:UNVERIFIED_ORG: hypothetical protein QE398_003987 [Atlantibacter sp. SORGH_AS 304]|nr:hypothetical protein [Atlantibacter sp. SORGH_AS_0304]